MKNISVKRLNGRLKLFSLGVSSPIIYSAGEKPVSFSIKVKRNEETAG